MHLIGQQLKFHGSRCSFDCSRCHLRGALFHESRPEARTPSPRLGGPLLPNHPNLPRTDPQTPQWCKPTASVHLQGIKTSMPNNLSLSSITQCLVSRLTLQYTPDDWQVHLIHRILQGYNSIFCAGTGYGKSLIFEGLAVLGGKGKLAIVISPLKALERDQVCLNISWSRI